MILKIELENFYSIKDKVTIDFRAGNINNIQARKLENNVIEWNGQKILKTVGLFGSNASGKSNIVKAISFCRKLILESHLYNDNTILTFQPFKFYGWDKKPSRFLVNFVCNNVEYEYSFSLTKDEFVSESLFYYPNKRKSKVFERNGDEYYFAEGAIPRAKDVKFNTGSKCLFLSRANSMNRELPKILIGYFLNTFMLNIVPLSDANIESLFEKNKKIVIEALNVCDSDICDIELKKEKMQTMSVNLSLSDKIVQSPVQTQEIDAIRFLTYHKFSPNVPFDMLAEESAGTQRLFAVLLVLLDVVKNGKSLMLDEFDIGLHRLLANFILDMIHASENSQMLFTSHNTSLIDMGIFRKDQILFVGKKDDGSTEVYSLYDFKGFRENMDAEKAYKQGRFEAVPIISTSVGSLKKLLED